MFEMIEMTDTPEVYANKKSGPHVDQLRAFMESRKTFVKLNTTGATLPEIRRKYQGLSTASHRPEFRGLVTVKRYGTIIQLIRQG